MKKIYCSLLLLVLTTGISTELPATEKKVIPCWYRKEISDGWKIKSITPRKLLDASFLSEAKKAVKTGEW